MGAWSCESFGNDTACDWLSQLEGATDLSLVEEALEEVLAVGDEYLEAPESSVAIAAAEAIARLQGNFGKRDSYSQALDDWVATVKLQPSSELAAKAHQVLNRILREPSELLELWEETADASAWITAVNELKGRIHT